MSNNRKRLSNEDKEKILKEQEVSGCTAKVIAAKYGISIHSIRNWKHEKKLRAKGSDKDLNKFVELKVCEPASVPTLEKASLSFKGVNLAIEGTIKSESLIAIIKILEEAC